MEISNVKSVRFDGASDQLRSLHDWLSTVDALRGAVRFEAAPTEPGAMGPGTGDLVVTFLSGGGLMTLARVVRTWIQHRTGDVKIKITGVNGTKVDIDVRHVSRATTDAAIFAALGFAAEPETVQIENAEPQ